MGTIWSEGPPVCKTLPAALRPFFIRVILFVMLSSVKFGPPESGSAQGKSGSQILQILAHLKIGKVGNRPAALRQ